MKLGTMKLEHMALSFWLNLCPGVNYYNLI